MDAEKIAIEPSRLVAARLARSASRVSVAEFLRCSPSYYAGIELGQKSVGKHLKWIAEFLRFPEAFFGLDPLKMPVAGSFSYRRKSSMKVCDRHSTESIGGIFAANLRKLIESYTHLPCPSVPDLQPFSEMPKMHCAESASAVIRDRFQMGDAPLRSAIDLVESIGALVFWTDGPREFDGVSFWVDERPFILLNRKVTDGFRVRFTVLHELAHLLLHRDVTEFSKMEDGQADSFASAMLMPVATYRRHTSRHTTLSNLLEDRLIWGASVRAQVRRAFDLGIISEWAYRDAFIRMNQRWGATEPNTIAPETSTTHRFMFEEAGDRGLYASDLANEADMPYDLFLAAFPTASVYERSANHIPNF